MHMSICDCTVFYKKARLNNLKKSICASHFFPGHQVNVQQLLLLLPPQASLFIFFIGIHPLRLAGTTTHRLAASPFPQSPPHRDSHHRDHPSKALRSTATPVTSTSPSRHVPVKFLSHTHRLLLVHAAPRRWPQGKHKMTDARIFSET